MYRDNVSEDNMQMGIIILESAWFFNLIFNPDGIFDQIHKVIGKRREAKRNLKLVLMPTLVLIA